MTSQVDYTSRDYTSIRADMISQIQQRMPTWTSRDPSDFGITLVELFAGMGDMLSYHIDRVANESYLDTATRRDNILALARLLDYKPADIFPATTVLRFTNSTLSPITIPAGTQVATTVTDTDSEVVQIVFETDVEVVCPAATGLPLANGTVDVTATEGRTTSNEILGTSDSSPNQSFQIYGRPVIEGSVSVTSNGITYRYVEHLLDYSPNDPVFTTYTNSDQVTWVIFGDGLHGKIPAFGVSITASYKIGSGTLGNVAPNSVTTHLSTSISVQSLKVTNVTQATGGSDRESIDSIRRSAPQSFYTLNRAITTRDYALLALRTPGVAKASAKSSVFSSVGIYVAPTNGYDGIPLSDKIKASVAAYLADKVTVGTGINISSPEIVDMYITVEVLALPQWKRSVVLKNVNDALMDMFSFDKVDLGDAIPLMYVMATLDAVPGVMSCNILSFNRDNTTAVNNQIDFGLQEIPRLLVENITSIANSNYGLSDDI